MIQKADIELRKAFTALVEDIYRDDAVDPFAYTSLDT